MKKLIVIFYCLMATNAIQAQTNEKPLQNNNTKTNINTTNNNSNSGVNPNGNPGTIISSSAISGGNPPSSVSPYPHSPPSQYLQEVEVKDEITEVTPQPVESVPVKSITKEQAVSEPLEVVEIKRVDALGGDMKVVNIPNKKGTYRPIYQTYIPQNIVQDIKKKFGDNVYDIVLLNSKSGKQVYVVRIIENGVFRTERLAY